MKIVTISDTHNKHERLTDMPEGDICIHAGDFSMKGYTNEVKSFLDWYSSLPYKHKIFIAGNHDLSFENNDVNVAKLLEQYPTLTYLKESSVNIDGINIWGSPATPRFGYNWAFNYDRGREIKQVWDLIPANTGIVVTHGPAWGFGDISMRGYKNVGCADLLDKLREIQPALHICGHIHEGYGLHIDKDINSPGHIRTTFVNASVLDEFYHAVNAPRVIDYNELI